MKDQPLADADLAGAIRACLPAGATFDCGALEERQGPLFAQEEAEITRAVTSRRMGFRAGRTCARNALGQLGVDAGPVLAARDRRPLWPEGMVGSITHSDDLAAAVAGRSADFIGLGIDLEPAAALAPDLADAICRPEERGFRVPGVDAAKLVFVIKEAFYKAYYPATLQFLDFPDALVRLGPLPGTFSAHLINPDHPGIEGRREIEGLWTLAEGHLLAVAALPRE
ncbi:4'-phosphopantetheinyl transferase EntD [Breoghania corrubedonensis]|uniref:Enterobactin synthase component D n=1 Tax=Breoghania corrubedonensis TaxID=665038 RepID=A0A2T5V7W0_9HYPH|nr:4'-phosphopantetheinyl transferase superfamily protein [Breoghania corrubedonensis]PTW59824.1 4'-phosphopantetheinyl transferase EntD [Breoghania corrubedonensis]